MTDMATAAILVYGDSLVDSEGKRRDLIGSATITVTLYGGGGGSFGSDGTCHFTCGTVATKIDGVDLTRDEQDLIRKILIEAIERKQ